MKLNSITEKWVEAYVRRPAATLLIDCPDDVTAGIELAQQLYNRLHDGSYPLVKIGDAETKSIGIDDIRDLQRSLSYQADRSGTISRIAVIEGAEKLTAEAQNALLKLVEEPPNRTLLFLVCAKSDALLETIRSRCFTISLLPISTMQAQAYAVENGLHDDEALRAHLLADGRWTAFVQTLNNEDQVMQVQLKKAKVFIAASVFERQKLLQEFYKNDAELTHFLHALEISAKAAMRGVKSTPARKKWQHILKEVLHTKELMRRNVSTKLALLAFSVNV